MYAIKLVFCKVGEEYGYFHTWEYYSKPLPTSPFVGDEPAGVFSQVFGIVEFYDGVRRIDPVRITFLDEVPKELMDIKKYIEEETK